MGGSEARAWCSPPPGARALGSGVLLWRGLQSYMDARQWRSQDFAGPTEASASLLAVICMYNSVFIFCSARFFRLGGIHFYGITVACTAVDVVPVQSHVVFEKGAQLMRATTFCPRVLCALSIGSKF